jgi:hypothetical protein
MARLFHSPPKLFGADMLILAGLGRDQGPNPPCCHPGGRFGSGVFKLKETFRLAHFMTHHTSCQRCQGKEVCWNIPW